MAVEDVVAPAEPAEPAGKSLAWRYWVRVVILVVGVAAAATWVARRGSNGAAVNVDRTDQNWGTAGNWIGNVAPAPLSSNIIVFQGDINVPYNWPYIDNNYGTTILIFSNTIVLNGIKILAGIGHTMNFGSYVLQNQALDAQSPAC